MIYDREVLPKLEDIKNVEKKFYDVGSCQCGNISAIMVETEEESFFAINQDWDLSITADGTVKIPYISTPFKTKNLRAVEVSYRKLTELLRNIKIDKDTLKPMLCQ